MRYPYISVYAPDEKDFSHNGLRILMPTSCEITEVLKGEYSLTMNHPLDEWGNWKLLLELYIIKAQGQLFRIRRKTLTMSSDGKYAIKVDAMHISYDLNYYFIKDTRPTLLTGERALEWITTPEHNEYQNILNGNPRKQFTFSTDIKPAGQLTADDLKTAYYEKMSVTKALISADNCFLNVWGGELYRDNFNFVINKRRGKDNAFSIRYGVDMIEIQQETDYSDSCSSIYYEATVINETIVDGERQRTETVVTGTASVSMPDMKGLPVPPMKCYSFEIDIKDIKCAGNIPTLEETYTACAERAREYLITNCQPSINYKIKFADLKNYDMYKDFIGLQECGLGDTGTVYHEPLGISTVQQIVKKTINGITGETISVELGNLRKSLTSELAKKR